MVRVFQYSIPVRHGFYEQPELSICEHWRERALDRLLSGTEHSIRRLRGHLGASSGNHAACRPLGTDISVLPVATQ